MGPDLLGTALVAEVEEKSGGQFIERLLPHPYLAEDQQHRALTVLARAAPTQPALAESTARAVAAAPDTLLPLAARTVTAELDPEIARPWLRNLQDAIAEQAQHPDAEPDTYAWAADLVSASLTHLETGLDDYFNSPDWEPPHRPPETEDGLEDAVDDPGHEEPDREPDDAGEEEDRVSADGEDDPVGPPVDPAGTTEAPRPGTA
ncbi:hypothetical protein ACIBU0_35855 [Streptomyces sp. NPDC049627]|uniref:hypothetical protein n=1 Tax=Streptomyces sp. NPDC049627 TaxID=3365595 RepID=UPI0037B860EE